MRAHAPAASLLLRRAAVLLALGLASCSSVPEIRVPERVLVQVPVPCVPADRRPQRPQLRAEADLLAMDRGTRTLAAWSDLRKAEGYIAELEAVVEGCSRIQR